MGKVILLGLLLVLVCRWGLGKWPWDYLRTASPQARAQARARARADACKLLSVPQNANKSDIISAHRRVVATLHPDRGGNTIAMQEANAARDLLLHHLPAEENITR